MDRGALQRFSPIKSNLTISDFLRDAEGWWNIEETKALGNNQSSLAWWIYKRKLEVNRLQAENGSAEVTVWFAQSFRRQSSQANVRREQKSFRRRVRRSNGILSPQIDATRISIRTIQHSWVVIKKLPQKEVENETEARTKWGEKSSWNESWIDGINKTWAEANCQGGAAIMEIWLKTFNVSCEMSVGMTSHRAHFDLFRSSMLSQK